MQHMMKKLPEGSEGAVVFCSRFQNMLKSGAALVRLNQGRNMPDLLEVDIPTR